MRVAILADIHGNDRALEAVLAAVRREDIDYLMICGDLIGYYFAPVRVLEMLRPWRKEIVRGNHEDMLALVRRHPNELARVENTYGSGLRVALESLSESEIEELIALPRTASVDIDGYKVLLCHGAPWDTDEYVYPDSKDDLLERCVVTGYAAVIMGHTHYPMLRDVNGVRLINPGSVGQPRNRRPGADWAVLDTSSGVVALKHETYDVMPLCIEAKERNPEIPYLHEVLVRT
jgi:putative phosphoesterase